MQNLILETEEDEDTESLASDRVQFDEKLYQIMEILGFNRQYLRQSLLSNDHTYGTAGMHLLQKYFQM